MLKAKFVLPFLTVLIFLFFVDGISSTGPAVQRRDLAAAISCTVCKSRNNNEWCTTGTFQGCRDSGTCSTISGAASVSCTEKSAANCGGCIAAGHRWCVQNSVDGASIANTCIDGNSNSGCSNGKIYSSCTVDSAGTTGPASSSELSPQPVIQSCDDCVVKDDHYWCSKGLIVDFVGCVSGSEKAAKCPGGRAVRTCQKAESLKSANPLSLTCQSCKAFNYQFCEAESPGGVAGAARKCFYGASCPAGLTAVASCPDSTKPESYTYVPAVSQDLPTTCSQCTTGQTTSGGSVYSWCKTSSADEVGTCLPTWSFRLYCPAAAAPCGSPDNSRSIKDHPLYLQQNCDSCVAHGNEWCITTIGNQNYQLCTLKNASLCVGDSANVVTNCKGLKAGEKEALIPTPVPKACDECIKKGNGRWCVHTGYGGKIITCMSKEAADLLCTESRGSVAFHHCNIAPEDMKLELGLLKLPGGSPAFASLSLMAVAVALGLSFF